MLRVLPAQGKHLLCYAASDKKTVFVYHKLINSAMQFHLSLTIQAKLL